MMYSLSIAPQFKRDAIACRRKGKNMQLLWEAVGILLREGKLPESYSPHMLHDEFAGCWECHIEYDWLIIWQQNDNKLTLLLTNTGTHKELFSKSKRV